MARDEGTPAPRYIAINRNQQVLQPLDVDRLIDEDHAARKIWRVVEQLDLSGFDEEARAVEGAAGRPSHAPQALVSVWLYAYSKGLHSAREIARQMEHEPGLEWLTGLRPINHHVTQRGNNRQDVFVSDADRRCYLDTLREKCAIHGVFLLGYCLTSNHVHLIAVPKRPDPLAQALGRAHGLYAQRFNRLRRTSGHLWQNRFSSCAVGPSRLLSALTYVDLNPVRAGMGRIGLRLRLVQRPRAHRRLGLRRFTPHLQRPFDPAALANQEEIGAALCRATQSGLPLGDAAFIEGMERRFARELRRQPPGPKPKLKALRGTRVRDRGQASPPTRRSDAVAGTKQCRLSRISDGSCAADLRSP